MKEIIPMKNGKSLAFHKGQLLNMFSMLWIFTYRMMKIVIEQYILFAHSNLILVYI